MINEHDQIRNMLSKVRMITEEAITNNNDSIMVNPEETENQEQTKEGEKVTFDGINTVGFLKAQGDLDDATKATIITSVGEFLKSTGLLLDIVSIFIEDSRIIMTTETIKNPGIDAIKSIKFDTDEENPQMDVISGPIGLDVDIINLLQTITKSYNDNQIGRNKLISATQGNIQ
jgi:hypothetical protein